MKPTSCLAPNVIYRSYPIPPVFQELAAGESSGGNPLHREIESPIAKGLYCHLVRKDLHPFFDSSHQLGS